MPSPVPIIRTSLYQETTDAIIAQLEQGCVPWVQPWQAGAAPLGRSYHVPHRQALARQQYDPGAQDMLEQARAVVSEAVGRALAASSGNT